MLIERVENFKRGAVMQIPNELHDYLFEIIDQARNGISVTDPNQKDNPLVFVNKSFIELFEYDYDEIIGHNCRFLQGEDREQRGIDLIRQGVSRCETVTVVLRNYTKSGRLVFNEVMVSPIFDKETREIKYFLGVQKDVTREQKILKQLQRLV